MDFATIRLLVSIDCLVKSEAEVEIGFSFPLFNSMLFRHLPNLTMHTISFLLFYRVHPAHARKMVKKMWDMGEGKDWPVFYYENMEGACAAFSLYRKGIFL